MQFLKVVLKLTLLPLGISAGGLASVEAFVLPPFSPQVVSRNLTSLLISLIMRVLMLNTILASLLDSVGGYFCVTKD